MEFFWRTRIAKVTEATYADMRIFFLQLLKILKTPFGGTDIEKPLKMKKKEERHVEAQGSVS